MPVTPRSALPYPLLVDLDNVPSWMLQLATALDGSMHGGQSGTLAARPAAGVARFYYATDTTLAYMSDGVNWRTLNANRTAPSAVFNASLFEVSGAQAPGTIYPVSWNLMGGSADFAGAGGVDIVVPKAAIYRVTVQLGCAHNHAYFINHVLELTRGDGTLTALAQGSSNVPMTGSPFGQIRSIPLSSLIVLDKTTAGLSSFRVSYLSSDPGDPSSLSVSFGGDPPIGPGGPGLASVMTVNEVCEL